jgi:hypothetical protein
MSERTGRPVLPNSNCVHEWKPSPVQPTVCHCALCGACDFGDNDVPREVKPK